MTTEDGQGEGQQDPGGEPGAGGEGGQQPADTGGQGAFDASMLADKPLSELLTDEDLRTHPSLTSYRGVEGLARSHVNLEKMLGKKDRLLELPGEDATPEQRSEFFAKLGRPDEPAGYQLQEPEGLPDGAPDANKDLVDGFRQKAHEAGLSTEQANELYSWFRQTEAGALAQNAEQKQEGLRTAEDQLRQQWGNAYDEKLAAAREAARAYGDDFVAHLEQTGMGNDPYIARVLADIAEARGEDAPRGGGAPASGALTPDQAKAEVRRLQGDETFQKQYYDQQHPNHDDAVRKITRLFEQAFPEARRG